MLDLIADSTWKKASDLIKEKYGKSLSYRRIKLIAESDSQPISGGFYSSGPDLIIPLKLKNIDLGDVVVTHGSLLDQQQKLEVTDLIKFLVEPKAYNIQLKKSEDNLTHQSKTLRLSPLNHRLSVVDIASEKRQKPQMLSSVILLKSASELARNRVALKIHEMTERNMFVHLEDLAASLASVEDFKSLSDTTIYIEDVSRLRSDIFQLLQDYLALNLESGPIFLVGTAMTAEAISQQNWSESFKKDLIGFYFDVDRVPVTQQTSEDVLELLFFQLDQH